MQSNQLTKIQESSLNERNEITREELTLKDQTQNPENNE